MKKTTLAWVLSTALIFAGCASSKEGKTSVETPTSQDKQLKVVTTIFPCYDFARAIIDTDGDVTMLLKPGSESHSFEPTPKDMQSIKDADLLIYVGSENDTWVENLLKDNKDIKTFKLVDHADTEEEEIIEGMQHEHHHEHADHDDHDHEEHMEHDEHEHTECCAEEDEDHCHEEHEDHDHEHEDHDHDEHEHHHHEIDEHVWTSLRKSQRLMKELCETLVEIAPEHKDAFEQRSNAYISEMADLDEQFKKIVENGNRKTIVFGDRFPIRYFVDDYGLNYYAAFPGCAGDTEVNASTLSYLTEKVKEENIPVVYTIELSNGRIADTICESTNAKKVQFNTCHNVTGDEFNKGVTYISLMKDNLKALEEGLK